MNRPHVSDEAVEAASKHALTRTSPKGTPFIGTCMKCGQAGLTTADMSKECPNVAGMSDTDALLHALEPPMSELQTHAETARKLLANPEWTPTRLLWSRLLGALEAALAGAKP